MRPGNVRCVGESCEQEREKPRPEHDSSDFLYLDFARQSVHEYSNNDCGCLNDGHGVFGSIGGCVSSTFGGVAETEMSGG